MTADPTRGAFSPARPLPAGACPRREAMPLADGYMTYVIVHDPPGAPRPLPVVYLHGIQSHPAWFAASAAHLAAQGYPVFQVARRGSGANTRDRGHAASAGQLFTDVAVAVELARGHGQGPRVHLVGVSWGGKLAAAYAADPRYAAGVASVTLVTPGIVSRVDVAPRIQRQIAMSLLLFRPRRLFDIPLNEARLFTDNPPMQAWLDADPLRLHKATARFLYVSRKLEDLIGRTRRGMLGAATTLLLAGRDRIIDNPRTRELVDHLTGGRTIVRQFDAAHTLEFEPDPREYFEALTASLQPAPRSNGA